MSRKRTLVLAKLADVIVPEKKSSESNPSSSSIFDWFDFIGDWITCDDSV